MTNLIKLQKLATQISARMVRSTIESLDEDIMQSLMQLAVMLDVERVGLLEVREDSPVTNVAYAWYSNGAKQVPREVNLVEGFPWAYERLVKRGQVLSISKLSDYPPEAHIDKKSHESLGTKSILTIPLMIGSRVHHLLAVHTLCSERVWSDDVVSQVRLFGEIFVSALQRREVEFILKRSNERLNLAAQAADCGLWELDLDSGIYWITQKARQHFNFAPD